MKERLVTYLISTALALFFGGILLGPLQAYASIVVSQPIIDTVSEIRHTDWRQLLSSDPSQFQGTFNRARFKAQTVNSWNMEFHLYESLSCETGIAGGNDKIGVLTPARNGESFEEYIFDFPTFTTDQEKCYWFRITTNFDGAKLLGSANSASYPYGDLLQSFTSVNWEEDPIVKDAYFSLEFASQNTPPTNQPPVALFTPAPQNSTVGESVFFDASASYDPDPNGFISLYGWDWDGNGMPDQYTNSPYANKTWELTGKYEIGLTVIDNLNGQSSTSSEITVSLSPKDIGAGFIINAFRNAFGIGEIENADLKDLERIDEWLRDKDGHDGPDYGTQPFDWWIKGAQVNTAKKLELLKVLDSEFIKSISYREYILSVIEEQEMVEHALMQQTPDPYRTYMMLLLDWLPYKDIIDFYNDTTSQAVRGLLLAAAPKISFTQADVFTFGSSFLSLGLKAQKLNDTFKKIDDSTYRDALAWYFSQRRLGAKHDNAWGNCGIAGICAALKLTTVLSQEMLAETEVKFQEWYENYDLFVKEKYGGNPHIGLNNNFKLDLKQDIKSLILSLQNKNK